MSRICASNTAAPFDPADAELNDHMSGLYGNRFLPDPGAKAAAETEAAPDTTPSDTFDVADEDQGMAQKMNDLFGDRYPAKPSAAYSGRGVDFEASDT